MNSMETISQTIKTARQKSGHKTAKEFWEAAKVHFSTNSEEWISYPYYQQIEAGTRNAPIEVLLQISNFLKLDLKKICFLYARSQMPTQETQNFFDLQWVEPQETALSNTAHHNWEPDQVINVADEDLRFFSSHPDAYDIMCAITCNAFCTSESLAHLLGKPHSEILQTLELLNQSHLVIRDGELIRPAKAALRIHGTHSNRALLWKLTTRHHEAIHHRYFDPKNTSPCFRSSTCISIQPEDAQSFLLELRQLAKHFDSLEQVPSERNGAYYLGIMFGERFQSGGPAYDNRKTKEDRTNRVNGR